jgi:hypothetical protein
MKRFIYQSPKHSGSRQNALRSVPIAEDNTKARGVLEGKGWRIVETLTDDVEAVVETVEVEAVKPAPKRRRKAAD